MIGFPTKAFASATRFEMNAYFSYKPARDLQVGWVMDGWNGKFRIISIDPDFTDRYSDPVIRVGFLGPGGVCYYNYSPHSLVKCYTFSD